MLKTFSHGIHPPEFKEITSGKSIKRFPFAPYLIVLLSQHTGAPAKPIVHERQEVARGETIAVPGGFVSVAMHAPATGIVKKVGDVLDADGKMTPAIVIEPFKASEQLVQYEKQIELNKKTKEELVKLIQDIGMVGLGGAAFPTHVKFSPPPGKTIETLLINGCECEPYLTSDHRVMLEETSLIIEGVKIILKITGAKKAIIVLESNKKDAAKKLEEILNGVQNISVSILKTKYPQGAEKMITRALLGKDIPSKGLPVDIGVMVSNITTVYEIANQLPYSRGLIERVITISGKGVDRPGNYIIPVGTPIDFILENAGMNKKAKQVILGGPMMGKCISFLETPITKGISGIVVLSEEEVTEKEQVYPCILCAECLKTCPMHLNPSRLGRLARKNEFDEMADNYHLYECFECGCCSYVCPSNIPLVQMFRIAKKVLIKKAQQ
jgi:electron transport complex protein RnfC